MEFENSNSVDKTSEFFSISNIKQELLDTANVNASNEDNNITANNSTENDTVKSGNNDSELVEVNQPDCDSAEKQVKINLLIEISLCCPETFDKFIRYMNL